METVLQALVEAVREALLTSADKLVRVESLVGQDGREFVDALDPHKVYRFGKTGRLKNENLGRTKGISNVAAEITKWRNESPEKRRSHPIVILGDARGRDEAGLRKAPKDRKSVV